MQNELAHYQTAYCSGYMFVCPEVEQLVLLNSLRSEIAVSWACGGLKQFFATTQNSSGELHAAI
jgi:hypothetical protein